MHWPIHEKLVFNLICSSSNVLLVCAFVSTHSHLWIYYSRLSCPLRIFYRHDKALNDQPPMAWQAQLALPFKRLISTHGLPVQVLKDEGGQNALHVNWLVRHLLNLGYKCANVFSHISMATTEYSSTLSDKMFNRIGVDKAGNYFCEFFIV